MNKLFCTVLYGLDLVCALLFALMFFGGETTLNNTILFVFVELLILSLNGIIFNISED